MASTSSPTITAPRAQRPPAPPTASEPTSASAARLIDVVKVYGSGVTEVRALDGVSLSFPSARFTSIMGASGSGKSTLLHCAAALDEVTAGQVFIGDADVSAMNDRQRTVLRRTDVGFVFQSFNLVPTLSAEENITLPLDLARARVDRAWFDQVTRSVGIADRLAHRPHELSGGQQQRVAVARALLARPSVVFADEPTGSLDSHSSGEVLALLRQAVDEYGQTVVMVTHDPFAASVSDSVVLMRDGRLDRHLDNPSLAGVLDLVGRTEG